MDTTFIVVTESYRITFCDDDDDDDDDDDEEERSKKIK